MRKVDKIFRKVISKHNAFASWYVTYIPPILILFALILLISTSLKTFRNHTFDITLVIFYLTAIGLTISMSSCLFSYARLLDEKAKKMIIKNGEYFLSVSVFLILAFLLNWIAIQILKLFGDAAITKILSYICIGNAQAMSIFGAIYCQKAVIGLKEYLYTIMED